MTLFLIVRNYLIFKNFIIRIYTTLHVIHLIMIIKNYLKHLLYY